MAPCSETRSLMSLCVSETAAGLAGEASELRVTQATERCAPYAAEAKAAHQAWLMLRWLKRIGLRKSRKWIPHPKSRVCIRTVGEVAVIGRKRLSGKVLQHRVKIDIRVRTRLLRLSYMSHLPGQ